MRKHGIKRFMAMTLSAAMVITGMSIPAFAAQDELTEDVTVESVNETVENENSEELTGDASHTIWIVGDSTVCTYEKTEGDVNTHTDSSYYYPRYGYGTQIKNYVDTNTFAINNLALSGRSSVSFLSEANYDTLKSGIKSGDVLIIGFGHNDEKYEEGRYSDPTGDYQTPGSFAYSIYQNYVKLATGKGATAIVCSPIVRRGVKTDDNGITVLTNSEKHITGGDTGFNGGDYAQALRKMAQDTETPFVDLTEITRSYYESVSPNTTLYMHAWASNKPTSVDNTHLNKFGAKWIAYQFCQAAKDLDTPLKGHFTSGATAPVKDIDLVSNPNYVIVPYEAPTAPSTRWAPYISKGGIKFFGTIFGSLGSTDGKYYTFKTEDNGSVRIAVTEDKGGKIASKADGFVMYYVQLPADLEYKLTATATVNSLGSGGSNDSQAAFGLTARDDMYIDKKDISILSDYVVAGSLGGSAACNCFKRKGSTFETGSSATVTNGQPYALSINKNSDGYEVTFGDNPPQSGGYDYQLTSVDSDYQYAGMFVTRCADVTFSDVKLMVKNKAGDMVDAGSEADDVSGLTKYDVPNYVDEGGEGNEGNEGGEGGNKDDQPESAEAAAAEGKGDVKDTVKVTVSANAKGKKEYSITAAPLVKDGKAEMSITLAKGSKVKLTGYDKKAGSTLEISPQFKKMVAVNGKGVLSAKNATASGVPALVKYTIPGGTGTINVELSVTVVEPVVEKVCVSGNELTDPKAKKKLTATVPAGSKDIDVIISMPINFKVSGSDNSDAAWSKLVIKNSQVLSSDVKIAVDNKDSKVHITAKEALKKGSVSVPFMVNGKKYTAKIKVK